MVGNGVLQKASMSETEPLLSEGRPIYEQKSLTSRSTTDDCYDERPGACINGGGHFQNQARATSSESGRSMWRDTNWHQKAIILYIGIVNFLNFLCNTAACPFLARVVLNKGGTVLLSSFILQVSMVTMAIFCVVTAKYQSRIGSKNLILSGQMLYAVCQIAFGTIGYFDNEWVLVTVGALLRAIQGVCQAALVVGGLTVVCQEFPDYVSFVFGIFEAAYGAGSLTGPYLGGFLFDESGGMMLPMALSGAVTLLCSALGMVVLKRTDDYSCHDTEYHMAKILKNPKALLVIGAAGTFAGAFTLLDATITVYLKSKGFSVTDVGQLSFMIGLSYCVFAALIGWVLNTRARLRKVVMTVGFFVGLFLPLMFTPNQSIAWIYVGGFAFAMCMALAFIPSFNELLYVLGAYDSSSSNVDMSLNSAVSGLWGAAGSFSNFVIPLVGSAIQLTLQFSYSFSLSLLAGYIFTLVLSGSVALHQHIKRRRLVMYECIGSP